MRPEGVNDLEVIWAIRNIPQSIISKANELCLLFLFVSIIGNRPSCWYNLDQLSEKARLSKNTLKKVLKSLLDKNLISIKKPEKYGRGISSEYTLNYQKILNASKTPVDNSEQKGSNSDAFNEERDQNLNKKESNSDPLERYKERHKEKRGEKPSFFPSVQQPKPKEKSQERASPKKTELKSMVPWRKSGQYAPNAPQPSPLLKPEPHLRAVVTRETSPEWQNMIASLKNEFSIRTPPKVEGSEKQALETMRKRLYGK